MKSITKILCVFLLCVALASCIQNTRVKKILHKSQKHHVSAALQAKMRMYMQVADSYERRDQSLSQFPEIRTKMTDVWQKIVAQGTDFRVVDSLVDVIKADYQAKVDAKSNAAEKKPIQDELDRFLSQFTEARAIDEEVEHQFATLEELKRKLQAATQKDEKDQLTLSIHELNNQIMKNQFSITLILTKFSKKNDVQQFYKNIVKAIEESMPENFCYKNMTSITNVGRINFQCPASHPEKYLALCYERCDTKAATLQYTTGKYVNSEFRFKMGTCWEQCKNNICKKSALTIYPNGKTEGFFNWLRDEWHIQRSFIPSSRTFFDSSVTCKDNEVHFGALCYPITKQCSEFGYVDCDRVFGTSCSLNSLECRKVIQDMTVSTITGLAKFSTLFVAPGAASIISATSAAVSGLNAIVKVRDTILVQRKTLSTINNNAILRQRVIADAVATLIDKQQTGYEGKTYTAAELQNIVGKVLSIQVAEIDRSEAALSLKSRAKDRALDEKKGLFDTSLEIYSAVSDGVKAITETAEAKSTAERLLDGLKENAVAGGQGGDFLTVFGSVVFDYNLANNVYEVYQSCSTNWEQLKAKKIDCAKALIGVVATFDPTGLAGIAKAFMYNTCKA